MLFASWRHKQLRILALGPYTPHLPVAHRSSGDAIRAIREVAQKELPVGYGIEFGGITREESQTGSNIVIIFIICVFFVYHIMVALYESLFIPLAVILGVPFGLLCKTAILLTEYATQCRQAGMSLKQSAFFAAKMRLRPILMTSLTMIFGMLPLMFASGAGANGSRTVGVACPQTMRDVRAGISDSPIQ